VRKLVDAAGRNRARSALLRELTRPTEAPAVTPLLKPRCRCFALEESFWSGGGVRDIAEDPRRRSIAGDVEFHAEPQDTECSAWQRLLELVDEAAANGSTTVAPLREMDLADQAKIVTLPPTIAKLKAVTHLYLYRSNLVRIPREIGEMSSLQKFTPYTSYRLHWFPYEITRCTRLRGSTVSTRALYGNFKLRPPFPRLEPRTQTGEFDSGSGGTEVHRRCSVCNRLFQDLGLHRVWISLWVGSDVLPLRVNACSEECIRKLPTPANGHVQEPHRGGLEVEQPDPLW